MRERFSIALEAMALQFEQGEVGKHRSAEELGKAYFSQILSSREDLEVFLAGIETTSYSKKAILKKMCRSEVVARNLDAPPRPEVFSFLSEELTNKDPSKRAVATNFLEGIFLYPAKLYQRDRKDPEGEQRSLEEAIKASTETLYHFAWALILSSNQPVQEEALALFQKIVLASQGKTLFDLADRPYLLPSQDWEEYSSQANVATLALGLLFIKLFGEKRYQTQFSNLLKDNQLLDRRLVLPPPLDSERETRSRELASGIGERLKRIRPGIEAVLSQPIETKIYYQLGVEEPLLNEAIRLQMEIVAEELLGKKGIDFVLVDFPERVIELIFHEATPEHREKREAIISNIIQSLLAGKLSFREQLNTRELETIIDYLGPDYPLEVLLSAHNELYERVLTGILALPRVGQRVRLRLNEEVMLQQMGLTSLFFKPYAEGGVLVKLEFGKYHFSFALDRNFRPTERKEAAYWEEFSHLNERTKLFLLSLSYSYLDSLLHPRRGDEEIRGIKSGRTRGELVLMDAEETRDYLGKRTHLRTLPLGHHCRQIEDEAINETIGERFGFSLKDIWQTLMAAEEDFNSLNRLRESQSGLWGRTQALIERITAKGDGAEWAEVDGQLRMRVPPSRLTLDEEGRKVEYQWFSQEERIYYEVTGVQGKERLHPAEVVCLGAASRIAAMAER